jgi:saccharopine dehydrogenase (NAD+, L-lysine-forming)
MRVLVLGGAGTIGSEVAEHLAKYPDVDEVVLGDILVDKAEKLASKIKKAKALKVDVTDRPSLIAQMQKADVVVGCVGPYYKFGVPIVKAAVEAGVNFVDIMDDPLPSKEVLEDKALFDEAKRKNISVVIGLGSTPGLSNVLAKYGASKLDEVESIDVSWIFTTAAGDWKEVVPMVDGREVQDFLELGNVEVYHVGHPEPVTIPRYIKAKKVTCKAGMVPGEVVEIYRMLNKLQLVQLEPINVKGVKVSPRDFIMARFASLPMDIAMELFKFDAAEPLFEMRIAVSGKKGKNPTKYVYKFSDVGHEFATAISAVIGAIMLGRGQVKAKGVFAPEGCIEPEIFLKEIKENGVVIQETYQTSAEL